MESIEFSKNTDESLIYTYIQYFFIGVGIITYLSSCLVLEFYFKSPNFIKNEIFTYIFFHTLKNLVAIILPQSTNAIFLYCLGIVEFFLILSHLNKCFTSKNISENTNLYELTYRFFILAVFIACSFPYENYFKLIDQYVFTLYILNLILSIIFFRYINIKMNLILDYLKDKKVTNSSIPDLYLPYIKANYYYNNFSKVNNIFYITFVLVIIYYIINILNLFFDLKIVYKYLVFFTQEFIFFSVVIACLIYFYCLNKDSFNNNKVPKEKEEAAALNKFRVIDVDIQHEDDEINQKANNKNKIENEEDEKEKFKNGNKKNNDENEKLKN